MRIAVIMPTRGRPRQAYEAYRSVVETTVADWHDVVVVPVLDQEDPAYLEYRDYDWPLTLYEARGNMIERTNLAAMAFSESYDIIGWMADDNRMRTPSWDLRVRETFRKRPDVGFVYLNDLFWSEMFPKDKPVNTFIRSSIVKALGWFANPGVEHHYMDDTWRILGISTDSMVYLRDVVCEHMHPAIGKGEWDDQLRSTESPALNTRDQGQFMLWLWDHFKEDREKVKACLSS